MAHCLSQKKIPIWRREERAYERLLGQKLFLHRYVVFWTTRDAVMVLFYWVFVEKLK